MRFPFQKLAPGFCPPKGMLVDLCCSKYADEPHVIVSREADGVWTIPETGGDFYYRGATCEEVVEYLAVQYGMVLKAVIKHGETSSVPAVTYHVEVEPEDLPLEGNVQASGDSEDDERVEEEVRERLRSGDVYAWCMLRVTARWGELTGVDTVGACCLEGEHDVEEQVEHYGMRESALGALRGVMLERGMDEEFVDSLTKSNRGTDGEKSSSEG